MNTIIMLFLFPIGLYTYFVVEKRTKKEYQQVFDDFQTSTSLDTKYTDKEKRNRFEQMLHQNGYEVISVSKNRVVGEKKVLSMGLILIGLGIYIVGLFFYLAYYFWFQKPHRVEFTLKS